MKIEPPLPLNIERNVPLARYTTYHIGGPAKYFAQATSVQELQSLIEWLYQAKERYMILGKGSNLLFDDRGFDGMVILNKLTNINWDDNKVRVESGYSFALLGVQSARRGLSGLEFASGIPGSVGGAIYMNAGANQTEVKDALKTVDYIDETGALHTLPKEELEFYYRGSVFQRKKGAVVSATFLLTPSESAKEKQRKLLDYRLATQPYKDKTCGCTFRNPEQGPAGRLIDECGLKEMAVGDAIVSPKHANFIVNRGKATAQEIKQLIGQIKHRVFEKTGIMLEEEVCFIPFQEKIDE